MRQALLIALAGVAGFALGSAIVEPDVRVEYRDRVQVKRDVQIVEREVTTKRPDGTEVTEVTRETKEKDRSSSETQASETRQYKPQWSVGVYSDSVNALVTVDRRLLGNVFLGAFAYTPSYARPEPSVGVGIRIEF